MEFGFRSGIPAREQCYVVTKRDEFLDNMKKHADVSEGTWAQAKAKLETEWNGFQTDVKTYVSGFRKELAQQGKNTSVSRLKNGRTISITNTAISGGGWIAIHEDITERVGDEEALFTQAAELARINMRFDLALGHMTQGLSMFDERKRLVVWNKRFAELYGVEVTALLPLIKGDRMDTAGIGIWLDRCSVRAR